jgi:hypothetical protein
MTPRAWIKNHRESKRNAKRVRAYLAYVAQHRSAAPVVIDLRDQEAKPAERRA